MYRNRITPIRVEATWITIGAGGLILMFAIVGVFGSFFPQTPEAANAISFLVGVLLLGWGLIYSLWPDSPINVYRRDTGQTVATIEHLWKEEKKGEYGTTNTYYVRVRFRPNLAERVGVEILLQAEINKGTFQAMTRAENNQVMIRHARENPLIALFEPEGWDR